MNQMDFAKTMITGGAGFIGSHLTDQLIKNGNDVLVLDNLSSGYKSNLKFCLEEKNFKLIVHDLKNRKETLQYLKDIDTVFHMAADPEVKTGFTNPELAFEQNVLNTYYLLENIRKSNAKKFVFASSSVVYGEPETIPTPESYGPLNPISIYGGTKLACEGLVSAYCNNYGIVGTIVRFANVVGRRGRHGVTWDFIKKLKMNKNQLQVLGNGKQTKSYIHVNDCIDGFLFSASQTKKNMDVFNIGNIDKIDVLEIASIVLESMNLKNVNIVTSGGTVDGRGWIGDVRNMHLDISKLINLGWKPKLDSNSAIKKASLELINETD